MSGYFLGNDAASLTAYSEAAIAAKDIVIKHFATATQPYSGATPQEIAQKLDEIDFCPEHPQKLTEVLAKVGEMILQNAIVVSHPTCIAHLHCPPLIPALAAETLIGATNQSMDSWDQSAAATILEQKLVDWLCQLFGYGTGGDGTFTSGGTQSNFMGMLLARDRYCRDFLNWNVQQQGLPPAASKFRIIASDVSHFTIQQSAAILGLGQQAVVAVSSDKNFCLQAEAVRAKIEELKAENLLPIAIVATAGTTDFGSIDAIADLATLATSYSIWLHVDAAYGGALMLSDRYHHYLNGIESADSITVDFHKLFYQPISCGAFLLKNKRNFDLLKLHADYLNPEANEEIGIPDLVTKSIQTTRRFDALKLFISLQALGKKGFSTIVETTIDLASKTAEMIGHHSNFELANQPKINAVVFRYLPRNKNISSQEIDELNANIRWSLLRKGKAVITQTKISGKTYLKLTLLNPQTSLADIEELIGTIEKLGNRFIL